MFNIYRTSKETQLHKDNRKRHILFTASEIFAEKGYKNTTIQMIVEKAEISIGTFYFYFKNKEVLFEQIYDAFIHLHHEVCVFANQGSRNIVEGFCRNKIAELWIFQKYKQLAKIMMIEAAGLNPKFEAKRAEFYKKSTERISTLFDHIHMKGTNYQYDSKIAALICNGTLYSVITEWLQEGASGQVLDYAYPIIIYNLNAYKIEFTDDELSEYVDRVLLDLQNFDSQIFKEV